MGGGGIISSAVSVVGKVVSGGAKLIGGAIKAGVGGLVSSAIDWVKETFFSVSETPSYRTDTATIDQTKKINELLDKCVNSYGKEAKKYEDAAKEIIETYTERLMDTLDEIKAIEILPEYIYRSLISDTKMLVKQIDNRYINSINNTFSLNNTRLLEILEMDAGMKKEKALQKLAIQTLEKTHDEFIEKFKNFLEIQQEGTLRMFNDLKKNKEENYKNAEKEFEKLKYQHENDKGKLDESMKNKQLLIKKLELIKL